MATADAPEPHPAPLAWVDGQVVPAAEATVPLLDEGVLRGDAVFEAVLVRRGRTHALERHLARLERSAQALDLPLPDVRPVVAELLAAWGERDGALRVLAMRGGTVRGIASAPQWPASIALATVDAPWRTALSGVKTLSYAANQWAVRQAVAQGADDAVVIEGGAVLELPTGAICLVRDGEVLTPDPDRLPILRSITVACLDEVAPVALATPGVEELLGADEVFVLSATRPILPVHALVHEGHRHELAAPGPITADLAHRFAAAIDATLD